MRAVGLVSIVLCTAAFILAFLCIFAGSKSGMLDGPNYSIISLNTSRIGENIIQEVRAEFSGDKKKLLDILNKLLQTVINGVSKTRRSDLPFQPVGLEDIITEQDLPLLTPRDIEHLKERGIIDTITGTFQLLTDPNKAFEKAEQIIDDLQQKIGLDDFYSFHVREFCEGQFTPTEVPNATVTLQQINRNVTTCKGYLHWKPGDLVQTILNKTRLSEAGITLEKIHWPTELDDKVIMAEKVLNATMWLYVVTIILAFLAAIASAFVMFSKERKQAILGIVLSILALLGVIIVGVASIITTMVAVQVDKIVKDKGGAIGLQTNRGNGFMGLTWACFGCLFIVSLLGCAGCCGGMRRKKRIGHKHG